MPPEFRKMGSSTPAVPPEQGVIFRGSLSLPADSKGHPGVKPVQPKAANLAAAQSTEGHGFA